MSRIRPRSGVRAAPLVSQARSALEFGHFGVRLGNAAAPLLGQGGVAAPSSNVPVPFIKGADGVVCSSTACLARCVHAADRGSANSKSKREEIKTVELRNSGTGAEATLWETSATPTARG